MNSQAPGITFGFTRVNSILERNKRAAAETFEGREQHARGMPCRVSPVHFNCILMDIFNVVSYSFFSDTSTATCTISLQGRCEQTCVERLRTQSDSTAAVGKTCNNIVRIKSNKHLSERTSGSLLSANTPPDGWRLQDGGTMLRLVSKDRVKLLNLWK